MTKFINLNDNIRQTIKVGLTCNPTPWIKRYNTMDIDLIEKQVMIDLQRFVDSGLRNKTLFDGITYLFPSTVVSFTKYYNGEEYVTSTLNVTFLYHHQTLNNI